MLRRTFATASTYPARAIVARPPVAGIDLNWSLENIKIPATLKPHELLIETKAVGVCHTDIALSGAITAPKVFGHEGAAIVKAVGSAVTVAQPGDPVLMSYNYCGDCATCLHDTPAYCEHFEHANTVDDDAIFLSEDDKPLQGRFFGQSTFSSLSIAEEHSVVNAKDMGLTQDEFYTLGPLGCGIQTGAGATFVQAGTKPGHAVAVYGIGGVGLSAVAGAFHAGASTIIAVDVNEKKLEAAKEFGATHVIKAGNDDEVHAKIMEITGRGTDIGFEGVGGARFVTEAIRNSAVRGKVLYVGIPKDYNESVSIPLMPFLFKGGRLEAVIEGGADHKFFIPEMVKWYKNGTFPVDKMVAKYPIEDFKTAIDDMKKGKVIKPVLIF
uniref:Aryl-alcohol dehydrogenase n=1 Tax=Cyberlindnera americana TaxID=36016 RepID=A0A5P8N9P5_9ASCO|nr:aryl-alcohol dehydrogenase [Cyberlindnera americana]